MASTDPVDESPIPCFHQEGKLHQHPAEEGILEDPRVGRGDMGLPAKHTDSSFSPRRLGNRGQPGGYG